MNEAVGELTSVTESVVQARIDGQLRLSEQVWVGQERLTAEVIALAGNSATIQVYEQTTGLRLGEPLYSSGNLLSATLGPGLLGQTFDGIQRPLDVLQEHMGAFVQRGENIAPLDSDRRWPFTPCVAEGDEVEPGALLGVLPETPLIEHRVLLPPGLRGRIVHLVDEGEYTINDEVAVLVDGDEQEHTLTLTQRWPVRRPRPIKQRHSPSVPLITGQRIVDTFFPIAKGGTAAVPGPFGSGKTVMQQSLAKWSDADIIIYVGCGERGNEMADVLEDFPELEDPRSGHPLMERTVMIANTSNMPVAARESSIYTGITIAEYYRDQGYNVALMADSTSRWAEALRELSGRLEEMPAEEGFPAYLPSRLAAFYERAGRVTALGDREGSVSVIGAVSPPGGDFSEPVTRNTQRFTQTWWALDRDLANKRHYPAINWLNSYSLYLDEVAAWWDEQSDLDWRALRRQAMHVLDEESSLQQIVRLVGPDALGDQQQWVLSVARLLREGFLQQNAMSEVDAQATPRKQELMLRLFVSVYQRGGQLLDRGIALKQVQDCIDIPHLIRLKEEIANDDAEQIAQLQEEIMQQLAQLGEEQ
ncbi:MAG: V-type ATP synthase subunit A [Chloroflexaceae bacterium]